MRLQPSRSSLNADLVTAERVALLPTGELAEEGGRGKGVGSPKGNTDTSSASRCCTLVHGTHGTLASERASLVVTVPTGTTVCWPSICYCNTSGMLTTPTGSSPLLIFLWRASSPFLRQVDASTKRPATGSSQANKCGRYCRKRVMTPRLHPRRVVPGARAHSGRLRRASAYLFSLT